MAKKLEVLALLGEYSILPEDYKLVVELQHAFQSPEEVDEVFVHFCGRWRGYKKLSNLRRLLEKYYNEV